MPRKKHKTPSHLDYLFDRHLINKHQYTDFWEGYWDEVGRSRSWYVDRFVSKEQLSLPMKKRNKAGSITISKSAAQEQADNMNGYIGRVTKTGRRSKRGKFWRAFPRRKK